MNSTLKAASAGFTEKFLAFAIDDIEQQTQQMLDAGLTLPGFLQLCVPCMEEIGNKFEQGEYFLPQLVVAAEMFKKASACVRSSLKPKQSISLYGDIVVGTPRGDLHDLGKDIFAALAQASGFGIHDLGVDVAAESFVAELGRTGGRLLGMSLLVTTAYDTVREVVELLEREGMRDKVFVVIGGGATESSLVDKLRVDAQTRDAFAGVALLKRQAQANEREASA